LLSAPMLGASNTRFLSSFNNYFYHINAFKDGG
jgi:hypothetical protein